MKKKKKKLTAVTDDLSCHEQFENSSRLGELKNRDPGPHLRIVQSDRLVSQYVPGYSLFT